MATTSLLLAFTDSCEKTSTAASIIGVVILLALVGGLVAVLIANSQARSRLTAANSELSYLRPEYARLQLWAAQLSGTPVTDAQATAYPTTTPVPAQWYPDPSGRHELRYWEGRRWSDHVSDQGVTSLDPIDQ
jgi:type II secretory pathway pseudopilin PulG